MGHDIAEFYLNNPIFLTGSDWFLKSVAILFGAHVVCIATKSPFFSDSTKHLVWLFSLFSLALIPVAYLVASVIPANPTLDGNLITLSASPDLSLGHTFIETPQQGFAFAETLLWGYSLVACLLQLRIIIGIVRVLRISRVSTPVFNRDVVELFDRLAAKLKLGRNVKLQQCREASSPFSCGIFNPVVFLPINASNWSKSTLEDVLLHELIHIKRLDWLTMLICHLITCLYWINPLCWAALKRVSEEAELSCDSAVLAVGQNAYTYAESLVYVAQVSRVNHNRLVQMMADNSQLPIRITRILENQPNKNSRKYNILARIVIGCTLMIGVFGNFTLISVHSAETQVAEYLELFVAANQNSRRSTIMFNQSDLLFMNFVEPQYPQSAAQRGVEGWNLFNFQLNEDGRVDKDSIRIIEADPPVIFDRASREAIAQFRFMKPNENIDGPQDINLSVNYVLDLNSVDKRLFQVANRDYLPRNYVIPEYPDEGFQESLEGYVLVEFSISKEGVPSGVVIIDRSPSDIFNSSAIEAATRLRYHPRILDGEVVESQGVRHLFEFNPSN